MVKIEASQRLIASEPERELYNELRKHSGDNKCDVSRSKPGIEYYGSKAETSNVLVSLGFKKTGTEFARGNLKVTLKPYTGAFAMTLILIKTGN